MLELSECKVKIWKANINRDHEKNPVISNIVFNLLMTWRRQVVDASIFFVHPGLQFFGSGCECVNVTWTAAGLSNLSLSNEVRSLAFRYILFDPVFLMLDVFPWPALHFSLKWLRRWLPASSSEKCKQPHIRLRVHSHPPDSLSAFQVLKFDRLI